MKSMFIKYALLFCVATISPTCWSIDWAVGVGEIYRADKSGKQLYSISVSDGKWKYTLTHWQSHLRTPWYPNHPEWGSITIPSHNTASITYSIYEKTLSDSVNFFIDFGISVTDTLSPSNSSDFNFRENIGLEYQSFRLHLRHTSNAGIKLPNEGEDGLVLEYRF